MAVKNKKVAAGVGIAAVAAAALALGAGTFASFSASTGGPNATVSAGTLFFGGAVNNNFAVGPLSPGQSSPAQTLTFKNGGTTNGVMTLSVTGVTNTEDGCRGDEQLHDGNCDSDTVGNLSPLLDATVRDGGSNIIYNAAAANLATTPISVAAGDEGKFSVVFTFRAGGGPGDNAAQGDSATFATKAVLEQAP